jgi:hypothetical protein
VTYDDRPDRRTDQPRRNVDPAPRPVVLPERAQEEIERKARAIEANVLDRDGRQLDASDRGYLRAQLRREWLGGSFTPAPRYASGRLPG